MRRFSWGALAWFAVALVALPAVAQKGDGVGGKVETNKAAEAPAEEAPADPPPAAEAPAPSGALNKRDIFKKTLASTVLILVGQGTDHFGIGTGFVVDAKEKLIVTNHHVVEDDLDKVEIVLPDYRNGKLITELKHYVDSETLPAKVIDTKSIVDLAVLQVPQLPDDAVPIKMAQVSAEPGEEVHSIGGNTSGGQGMWIFTTGTVRQVYENTINVGFRISCQMVETQSPINPGDSGGPVVNSLGELIGVTDSYKNNVNLRSFAIDISEVTKYLEEVRPMLHPKTADEYFARGMIYLDKGRYRLAIRDFNEAIDQDDKRPEMFVARGDAQRFGGEYDGAIENYAAAIRLDPKLATAFMGRGFCFKWKEQYETALRDFAEAISLDPTLILAYRGRGETYMAMNKPEDAANEYTEAIRQAPSDKNLYNSRGNAFLAMGENKKAYTDYTESIRLAEGTDSIPFYNRALALNAEGDKQGALADLTKAIELYDGDADFFMKRGLILHELKELQKALDDMNKALELQPNNAYLYVYRGNIFTSADMKDRAEEDYRKAESIDPQALAKKVASKHFDRRYFKVVNNTGEDLVVKVYYYTKSVDGTWLWYPAASANTLGEPAVFEVASGKSGQLVHDGFDIKCAAVRIWAEGRRTGKTWTEHKDNIVPTVPDNGYDAEDWESFTYTFE
ncbi:MAG: serine protease [Pirellulales bacterium]|nr:serine protease [Pirellulales bacterium]